MAEQSNSIAVALEDCTVPYADAALARLGYLHPDWQITRTGNELLVRSGDPVDRNAVRRDIKFVLYREKILAETLDLRRGLLRMVAGS